MNAQQDSENADKTRSFFAVFVCVGIGVFALWALWWFCVSKFGGCAPEQGQLGDLFGGINALFSGLALAGIVTALVLQSQELKFQKEDLELNRHELRKTAEANLKAAEALQDQTRMQLRAAELASISALLASVNNQVGTGLTPGGDSLEVLFKARKAYHDRLHDILDSMGRKVSLPSDCKSLWQ